MPFQQLGAVEEGQVPAILRYPLAAGPGKSERTASAGSRSWKPDWIVNTATFPWVSHREWQTEESSFQHSWVGPGSQAQVTDGRCQFPPIFVARFYRPFDSVLPSARCRCPAHRLSFTDWETSCITCQGTSSDRIWRQKLILRLLRWMLPPRYELKWNHSGQ